MAVAAYTKSGSKSSTPVKLHKSVFGVEVKDHLLLRDAYLAHLANRRTNNARTKRRGEVQGGGRKPWRQKGTGNARVGSSRTPLWRGGGIIFGPTGHENYSRKINSEANRHALRQALSLAADEGKIKVIDTFACPEGKVKSTLALIKKIEADGSVLIVVSAKGELVARATNNLPDVKAVQARYLNAFDVVNADTIVISKKSLDIIHEWLGGAK